MHQLYRLRLLLPPPHRLLRLLHLPPLWRHRNLLASRNGPQSAIASRCITMMSLRIPLIMMMVT